ncbi:hypothetical protein AK812_SmicGene34056 [Symbiodinium microadriaticum]|uniref:Uncharacterized protein n=1 Tax=Symbiodinium microadriaticum TaxID=2951 RepID=A0A1Q9CPZ8_SYMMI|nr:hypothetical protein AK812_SmicGene34056 [Symbiodinium microadriaticum]
MSPRARAFTAARSDVVGNPHNVSRSGHETTRNTRKCIIISCWDGKTLFGSWKAKAESLKSTSGGQETLRTAPSLLAQAHLSHAARFPELAAEQIERRSAIGLERFQKGNDGNGWGTRYYRIGIPAISVMETVCEVMGHGWPDTTSPDQ